MELFKKILKMRAKWNIYTEIQENSLEALDSSTMEGVIWYTRLAHSWGGCFDVLGLYGGSYAVL